MSTMVEILQRIVETRGAGCDRLGHRPMDCPHPTSTRGRAMTTNKPEVLAYHVNKENPEHRGVTLEALIRLSDYEALKAECEKLRKDAERYRYMKKGNQWIVAATQTGFQLDGGDLDDLIDTEMEQKR